MPDAPKPPSPLKRPEPLQARPTAPLSKTTGRPQPLPRAATPVTKAVAAQPPALPSPVTPPPTQTLPTRLGPSVSYTTRGLRMSDNEDALLSLPDVGVFGVADGSGGRWPADLTLKTLAAHAKHLLEFRDKVQSEGSSSSRLAVGHFFESVLNEAGRAVKDEMHRRGEGRGTAAAVALTFMGPFAYVAHIGDSRAYLLRGDKLRVLTTDHTLAMMRLKRGELSPKEYAESPFKKTLTQAIGVTPELRPDIAELRTAPGDIFLLCSDGLHRMLSDKRIGELLSGEADLQAKAEALCREADEAGGKDNTSVVLVAVESDVGREVTDVELKRERLDIARILGKCFLFQSLADAERLSVAPYFEYETFEQGDVICQEGEPGDSLYVIVSGKVRVTFKKAHLIDLGPGGYAGEIALAREGPRTATIAAAQKTMVLKLTRARFLEILRRRPTLGVQLALPLLDNVGQRLVDVRKRLQMVHAVSGGAVAD